ncbi:hypothetical protein RYZ26_03805 [Terasakiella sp. A23]|uniref:hypothetical protein n=1 Tax=Terasakiella sp. FCG-A23 TaxID=3080561 RepID=UPI002954229B|nr:hypothetical protein [Terasakiella sp. A23]MDV7338708.1 hypothetical protein [Terasakiella sp. A23]
MKRYDALFLTIIVVAAAIMGWKLVGSLSADQMGLEVRALTSLESFEDRAEKNKPDQKDIYLLARQWEWSSEITVQFGQEYVLHLATGDIQHAFHLPKEATGSSIDILIQPGREYLLKLPKMKPGAYAIGCTEYCGIEHNKMRSKLIVNE